MWCLSLNELFDVFCIFNVRHESAWSHVRAYFDSSKFILALAEIPKVSWAMTMLLWHRLLVQFCGMLVIASFLNACYWSVQYTIEAIHFDKLAPLNENKNWKKDSIQKIRIGDAINNQIHKRYNSFTIAFDRECLAARV